MTPWSVDLTTTPIAEDLGDMAVLIEMVADHVYATEKPELHVSVGGDVVARTIGITATVDAPTGWRALEVVVETFGVACGLAGLGGDVRLGGMIGPISVVPAIAA